MIAQNRNGERTATAFPARTSLLRDACRIGYRHKRKMTAVFLGTFVALLAVLLFFPRSYTSEARLFIRLGKESVTLDPTATTNDVINVNESRESEINSELEILRARVLFEDVVRRLGPDDILNPVSDGGWRDSLLAPLKMVRTAYSGEIGRPEQAVHQLLKTVSVNLPRKSNVFIISCKARSPDLAQRIVEAFTSAYANRHAQANRTSGSYDFFLRQADLLRGQLDDASQQLCDAKTEKGLASIDGQRMTIESLAANVESALLDSERSLASSRKRITALQELLTKLPQHRLAEESTMANAAVDMMRNELYKLQIEAEQEASRHTEAHPRVIVLRRQVEQTRKILEAEEAIRNQPTRKINETHQLVETDLTTTKATTAAQEAMADALMTQRKSVMAKIRAVNENEVHIADLTRSVGLLESSYRTYTENREQARIDMALESGRISNVNVVQPASFVQKPSSPRTTMGFALSFVIAAAAAALSAFVSEYLDPSLKTPAEAELALGLPVLLSVPRKTRFELYNELGSLS